jgi:acyl-CoA dehydrogenase
MIRDSEALQLLLDTVARFVRDQLVPNEQRVAESGAIPDEIVADMRALGLFGLTIPEEYGGLGLTTEEEMLVVMELCKTSPVFRSMIGTNNGIGSQGIITAGTEEQKRKYLPALASGALISSFALTEPDAGSDAAALRTTAVRRGDRYILNGTKRYITNAPYAGLFTVLARTGKPGAAGVSAFLVEADTPGLRRGKPERKMGQAGSQVCDVILEDCAVPASALLGRSEGTGFKTAMKVLDKGRLHIAAVCTGVASRMLQLALDYARERRQFGRPIAEFQLIQAMLAESQSELLAARGMLLEAARARDLGRDISTEAACAKLFTSEMCGRVADRAVQVFGGAGYMAEYGIERYYRDVRLFRIFEGTSQIQQLVIAKNMLRNGAIA